MITGDVVDSTSIPIEKRAGLLECMSSVLDDIKQSYSHSYEYFRGDSVQIVVDNRVTRKSVWIRHRSLLA